MTKGTALKLMASTAVMTLSTVACTPNGEQGRVATPTTVAVRPAAEAARYAERARKALADHDTAEAVVQAETAVAASPHDADYRALLGQAYLMDGRFLSAETALRDSLALAPDQPSTVIRLALAQIGRNNLGGAHATLAAAPAETPTADLGLAFALSGDTQAAIALLDAAARAPGADARVRQNLALAYALGGRWDEARATASQDLSASEVNSQLLRWAQIATSRAGWQPIAALLDVKPRIDDPGQPTQLALATGQDQPGATAVAANATPPTAVAATAAPEPAAAPPAPVATVASADVAAPIAAATPTEADKTPAAEAVMASASAPVESAAAPSATAEAAAPAASAPVLPLATETLADAVAPTADPAVNPIARAEPVQSTLALTRTVANRAAAARQAASARGGWVVQLGAYSTARRVDAGWNGAIQQYRSLNAYIPASASYQMESATLHRLSIAGFRTRAEARSVCLAIKARGADCFIRAAAGDTPLEWAMQAARAHNA